MSTTKNKINNGPIMATISFFLLSLPIFFSNKESVSIDAAAWCTSVALAGLFLSRYAKKSAHLYLLASVAAWLVIGVGLPQALITLIWAASAWSTGALILRKIYGDASISKIRTTEALLIGAPVLLSIWGVMLHFPINYQFLHIAICLIPISLASSRSKEITEAFKPRFDTASDWMRSIPFWAWAIGICLIGWVLRWTAYPSMGHDDHVLHLRMWTELTVHHRYLFDVESQIWALAPFTVDSLHAVLSLMAGADARGAINLTFAITLFALTIHILRIWKISSQLQWLLIILLASTPMLGSLLLTLHTELALSVIALAGVSLINTVHTGLRGHNVLGVIACAALCVAIKLPGAILGITLLVALLVRTWSMRNTPEATTSAVLGWSSLLLLIPLSFLAFHSYVAAWLLTENPVFPLYNAIFNSPLYPAENFADQRWHAGFNISSYIDAFFNTKSVLESGNYSAGWQYLFLLPAALVLSFLPNTPRGLRITLIPLFGFGLVMFYAIQYWRYIFPVMPLAGILFAALFTWKHIAFRRIAVAAVIICITLNFAFFTKVSWLMHMPPSLAYTPEGEAKLIKRYNPVAFITNYINTITENRKVIYPVEQPYGSLLFGTPLYVNHYAISRRIQFREITTLDGIGKFLKKENADLVITSQSGGGKSTPLAALLRDYLAIYGSPIFKEGTFLLYRISDIPVLYNEAFNLQHVMQHEEEANSLQLPFTAAGVQASPEPEQLLTLNINHMKQMRYHVAFTCPSDQGSFIAQINWDVGSPYYRLVPCSANKTTFTESSVIPLGASSGVIYVTARGTDSVLVEQLTIETQ